MLMKLTMANIKSHLRDYIVLLTGLVMSSAIFYMFANLATNEALIKSNLNFKFASAVFIFGLILLAIITLVYVMYANQFLLNMRQHDYGLFMMLGAKKSRVSQLLVLETMVIGLGATVIGIIIGILATGGLSGWLLGNLGLTIHHFNPVYPKAILVTLALFLVLFVVAALLNLQRMVRTPVLQLLKQADTVDRVIFKPVKLIAQAILGIGLLALGYWAMASITTLQLMAVPIAIVTITTGSYLIFRAVILLILNLIKKTNWATQKLNGFTVSQIMFRVRDYTKILTITSLLFAMALGAITVGAGFRRDIPLIASNTSAYTIAVNNPDATQRKQLKQLTGATEVTYQQKMDANNIYYLQAEWEKQPFEEPLPSKSLKETTKYHKVTVDTLKQNQQSEFGMLSGQKQTLKPQFVSAEQFQQISAPVKRVVLVKVKDIPANYQVLTKLSDSQNKNYPSAIAGIHFGSFATYLLSISIFGGLEFVGYFLGIAFLAMLASCLMFKILAGATQDQIRYQMLAKIGARRSLLRRSINSEILVLFALPGGLGIIDVLFGLQLFKPLMSDPYNHVWWIIGGFGIIYLGYYLLTIWLYQMLVLPAKNK